MMNTEERAESCRDGLKESILVSGKPEVRQGAVD
jgi:hypothetical protein